MNKYTHLPLNKEIEGRSGYYVVFKEVRLQVDEREVLYAVGQAVIESSCCGSANYPYVIVPGYIVNWQEETNKAGNPVTTVAPVQDKDLQANIRHIISQAENCSNIEFW
ncbi:hypothetical protein ACFLW1_01735 [Chloroflexota bacterium]